MNREHMPPELLRSLKRFLALLPDDVQTAVKKRWGVFGERPHTLAQAAQAMGIGVMDVNRLETSGRADLRRMLGDSRWL